MKPLPRVWTLTFLPLAVAILSEPAQGQDACARASGPAARAGWAAYADNDMTQARPSTDVAPGVAPAYESPETTHFSIIDRDGNAVSNTFTLNLSYGSKISVSGAGFLLNN